MLRHIGSNLLRFDRIDSTNEELKRRYAAGGLQDGTCAFADMQEAGKGRRGRSWQGSPGENIAVSIFLKPQLSPDVASMLTLIAALASAQACSGGPDLPPDMECKIKWPNDVILNGRKICGILTEMSASRGSVDYVIVGIGINVNSSSFPEELRDRATSLYLETGRRFSRDLILTRLFDSFEEKYLRFLEEGSLSSFKEEYEQRLCSLSERIRVLDPGGEYEGICRGINDRGELLVDRDGTIEHVYAGEISVRGLHGYI